MKLQIAIDRMTIKDAEEMMQRITRYADIVEVGTSLIKDYGLSGSVGYFKKEFPEQVLLADIKTCDEGGYEFQKCYEAGADLATVMGFSDNATIAACREQAVAFGKKYVIDLMGTDEKRASELRRRFPDAVFGVHLPSDCHGQGLDDLVRNMCRQFPSGTEISAAGGIKPESVPILKENGVDIVIVGSAVTKAEDPGAEAAAFAALIRK